MNLLKLFKRKTKPDQKSRESIEALKRRISHSQEAVFTAVEKIGSPVNGLAVAKYMGVDSASVTPRLAELTRKGRLKVAYSKRGLDGVWRRFYVARKASSGTERKSN